jgi:hypothetical protein
VWCVSPSLALACRPSPQQLFARHRRKPGHSELAVLGQSVVQAVRSSRQSLSPEHAASRPSNISFKRTAAPPFNSSVRPLLGCSLATCASARASPASVSAIAHWPCSAAASSGLSKLLALCSGGGFGGAGTVAQHGAAQAPNFSFKRTAAPPLNSSVRRQSIFLRGSSRVSRLGFVLAKRRLPFLAGLRCCLSCAWSPVASCARWRTSPLRTLSCARLVATWCSSSAVRSSRAGHEFRGIAGHPKQRYRAGWRRGFVLPSNISFKADGCAAA